MSGIVRVEESNLLNGMLGIAAYTAAATPMKLALATVTGTDTTAGTEVTGGSYARAAIAFSAPTLGTPTTTSNTLLITYTNMPGVTTTGIDVYDSTGTPVRRVFAPLTASKTTVLGDSLSFAATSVAVSLG